MTFCNGSSKRLVYYWCTVGLRDTLYASNVAILAVLGDE
jgi:hypothetical protein